MSDIMADRAKPASSSADILRTLQTAAAGLVYQSETDAPIEPVQLPHTAQTLTDADARRLLGQPADAPVERSDLATFFETATTSQSWHGPDETAIVERFRALVA